MIMTMTNLFFFEILDHIVFHPVISLLQSIPGEKIETRMRLLLYELSTFQIKTDKEKNEYEESLQTEVTKVIQAMHSPFHKFLKIKATLVNVIF